MVKRPINRAISEKITFLHQPWFFATLSIVIFITQVWCVVSLSLLLKEPKNLMKFMLQPICHSFLHWLIFLETKESWNSQFHLSCWSSITYRGTEENHAQHPLIVWWSSGSLPTQERCERRRSDSQPRTTTDSHVSLFWQTLCPSADGQQSSQLTWRNQWRYI